MPGGPLWFLDPLAWTFSVGSKTVLFPERKPWLATFASCLCGLPVQPRWEKHGRENPAELWLAPNATQYLPNLLRVLEAGRQVRDALGTPPSIESLFLSKKTSNTARDLCLFSSSSVCKSLLRSLLRFSPSDLSFALFFGVSFYLCLHLLFPKRRW